MFLLEYNELGVLEKITPDAPYGLNGFYLDSLPLSIEEMLVQGSIEQIEENGFIKYKIKGEQ